MNRCQQTIGHIVSVSQSCAIYAEHKTIAFSRRSSAVQVGFCSVLYQSRAALPYYQVELKKKKYMQALEICGWLHEYVSSAVA